MAVSSLKWNLSAKSFSSLLWTVLVTVLVTVCSTLLTSPLGQADPLVEMRVGGELLAERLGRC